jgi:hypothetical protein
MGQIDTSKTQAARDSKADAILKRKHQKQSDQTMIARKRMEEYRRRTGRNEA